MKKKALKLKKLKLNRETLRNLTERELQVVVGATNWNSCDTVTWRCPTNVSNCC